MVIVGVCAFLSIVMIVKCIFLREIKEIIKI